MPKHCARSNVGFHFAHFLSNVRSEISKRRFPIEQFTEPRSIDSRKGFCLHETFQLAKITPSHAQMHGGFNGEQFQVVRSGVQPA